MGNQHGQNHMRFGFRVIPTVVVAGGLLASTVIAQSSSNYMMEHVVVSAGAASAASQTWQMSVALTPDFRIGASSTCNRGFRTSLGLGTSADHIPVPIELSVRHSQADPQDVELTWTGADPLFQVYRSFSPSDVSGVLNLYQETDRCVFTDAFAHQESILFYLVLPRP